MDFIVNCGGLVEKTKNDTLALSQLKTEPEDIKKEYHNLEPMCAIKQEEEITSNGELSYEFLTFKAEIQDHEDKGHKMKLNTEEFYCDSLVKSDHIGDNSKTNCKSTSQLNHLLKESNELHTLSQDFDMNMKTLFVCSVCDQTFIEKNQLCDHLNQHSEGKPNNFILNDHLVKNVDNAEPHVCGICNMHFSDKINFDAHMRIHTVNRMYICNTCNRSVVVKVYMNKHKNVHNWETPYLCGFCNKSFIENVSLDIHIRLHKEMNFKCFTCCNSITQKVQLEDDLEKQSQVLEYNACEKTLIKERNSEENIVYYHTLKGIGSSQKDQVHLQEKVIYSQKEVVHPQKEIVYLQEKIVHSQKQINHFQNKMNHTQMKTTLPPKTVIPKKKEIHTCKCCNKSFIYKYSLQRHMRTHIDRNFLCEFCNKSFTQKDQLAKHRISHNAQGSFSCDQCNKNFVDKEKLDVHKLLHVEKSEHACDHCKKTFSNRYRLDRHLRVHTGERPFLCDICNKRFTENYRLKKHRSVHEKH